MLKKTIQFEDLDGNRIVEDFWFHLSKAELVELELSEKNGLAETLKAIVESEDGAQIVEHFKKIILLSYGVRGEDGRRFIKSKELSDAFSQTNAYSELFIELATDADAAAVFVRGVMPENAMPTEAEIQTRNALAQPMPVAPLPPLVKISESPSKADLENMSREELLAALAKTAEEAKTAE